MIEVGPFEWDDAKRAANLTHHKIDFAAALGFRWETAQFTQDTRRYYGELRMVAVGHIGPRLHVLVFTRRGERLRIISLRRANARERNHYEKGRTEG
jgi:uncharacterized DUF497 family protein